MSISQYDEYGGTNQRPYSLVHILARCTTHYTMGEASSTNPTTFALSCFNYVPLMQNFLITLTLPGPSAGVSGSLTVTVA